MRKTLITLLAFILFATVLFAQNKMEDVIYLKNGSVIRGAIQQLPSVQKGDSWVLPPAVRIELAGGSVFVFQQAEIDSMKKENALKNKIREINRTYFRRDRGFRNITEMGFIYGAPSKNTNNIGIYYNQNSPEDFGLSLHTVNGYQVWPYLFAGFGMGIDRFITYQQTFSPFYLRVASEFLKKKVTPYVFLDAGYSVMWKQPDDTYTSYKNKGGLYVSTGAGVRIYTRSRASVLISMSYKRNNSQTDMSYTYDASVYTTKRTYQRMVFNIGVSFCYDLY